MSNLPKYEVRPEGDKFRICLVFHDSLLPVPNRLYSCGEVARMEIARMEREDYAAWRQNQIGKDDK